MALTDNQKIEVINNSTGSVSYYSEFSRIERRWDKPNSVKKVPLEELRELVNASGGLELLEGYLLIKNLEVREELGLPVEKSYLLEEKDIKDVLKKSLSVLTDTLQNTTETIREKIAQVAIDSKLGDLDKLEAIKEFTNVDVLAAIQENKEAEKAKVKLNTKKK